MSGPGTELITVDHRTTVTAVAFGLGGRELMSGDDGGTVRVTGEAGGRLEFQVGAVVAALTLAADGTRVAVSAGTAVHWHDLESGDLDRTADIGEDGVGAPLLSPDGRLMAVFRVDDRAVVIADARNGEVRHTATLDADPADAVWSADSTRLAIATGTWETDVPNGAAVVIDTRSGQVDHLGVGPPVDHVAFTPDAAMLLSAGADSTLRGLDVIGGRQRWAAQLDTIVLALAVDPTGRWAVCGSGDTVRVLRTSVGAPRHRIAQDGLASAVAPSPDGRWVAAAADNGHLTVFDLDTGEDHIRYGTFGEITALAFSSDSGRLAVAAGSGALVLEIAD